MSRSGFEISPGIKVFTGSDHALGQFVDVASMDFAGCELDPQGEGYLVEWSQMFGFSQNKIGITVEELGNEKRITELVRKFLDDNGIKVAWRPEVGKTAWMKYENEVIEVHIDEIEVQGGQEKAFFEIGGKEMVGWCKIFFPTAEAALASIKVYDLEGNEVVFSRADGDFGEYVTNLENLREIAIQLIDAQSADIEIPGNMLAHNEKIRELDDQLKVLLDAQVKLARHSRDKLKAENQHMKAKVQEAVRCNEAGMKSAVTLHLLDALKTPKMERVGDGC